MCNCNIYSLIKYKICLLHNIDGKSVNMGTVLSFQHSKQVVKGKEVRYFVVPSFVRVYVCV